MKIKSLSKKYVAIATCGIAVSFFVACGGSSTDSTVPDGNQIVSNGGSGSRMSIDLEDGGIIIPTAERVNFKVTAIDPNGQPLSNIRIFCETERGIAIIEPSSGGVAFEHTGSSGVMSGVLGGLTPGSFLVECRGPQGFNLVARKSFKVEGEIPADFIGFPGAAGGNLGGGVITDPIQQDLTITQVTFSNVGEQESRTGNIDLTQIPDCDGQVSTRDPEPFSVDDFNAEFVNGLPERVFIESVEISIFSGSSLVDSSVEELGGLVVAAGGSSTLTGPFTELIRPSGKSLAGSSVPLIEGTYNVRFSFSYSTASGNSGVVEQTAAIRIGFFDNCN